MKAAWDLGRRTPEDLAIVGAGDIAHGDMLRVPLTTVSWSREELGREAARLILDQIELHPDGPFTRVVVPPSLRVRASCGAPVRAEGAGHAGPVRHATAGLTRPPPAHRRTALQVNTSRSASVNTARSWAVGLAAGFGLQTLGLACWRPRVARAVWRYLMRLIMRLSLAVLAAMTLTVPASTLPSAEAQRFWPEWRGPLGTGEAPQATPPREWSVDEEHRLEGGGARHRQEQPDRLAAISSSSRPRCPKTPAPNPSWSGRCWPTVAPTAPSSGVASYGPDGRTRVTTRTARSPAARRSPTAPGSTPSSGRAVSTRST